VSYPSSSFNSHAELSSGCQPTELIPIRATALGLALPSGSGCRLKKSDTGNGRLRATCHTPAGSRSHSVSAFLSASSRNREQTLLVQFGTAAAPTKRELLAAPLICSLTLNAQSF